MISWSAFRRAESDLADAGQALLYQFGVGLAFLSTVRRDGGPRTHPMCPIISEEGLFAFIVPSPKRNDLIRDRRYAMHTFPSAENEDAFYLTGEAAPRADSRLRDSVARRYADERSHIGSPTPQAEEQLFEFSIDTCLLTRTTGHGDQNPQHWFGKRRPQTPRAHSDHPTQCWPAPTVQPNGRGGLLMRW